MDAISVTDFITSIITAFCDSFGRCPLVFLSIVEPFVADAPHRYRMAGPMPQSDILHTINVILTLVANAAVWTGLVVPAFNIHIVSALDTKEVKCYQL